MIRGDKFCENNAGIRGCLQAKKLLGTKLAKCSKNNYYAKH